MPPRRVLLVAPRNPTWDALRGFLSTSADVYLIADADEARGALEQAALLQPTTAFIATTLFGVSTVPLVASLREQSAGTCVIIVSESVRSSDYRRYLRQGVSGYLALNTITAETIEQCLGLRLAADTVLVSRVTEETVADEQAPLLSVLIAERSDIVRQGLCAILAQDTDFVVTEAKSDFVAAARRLQPDLIIVDPYHGVSYDADLIGALHGASPASRLVSYTDAFEPSRFLEVMQDRVHACSSKISAGDGEALKEMLHLVGRHGWVVVDGVFADHFWRHYPHMISLRAPGVNASRLTERELVIVGLLAEGLSDKDISGRLGVRTSTVEYHVQRAREKLEVSTRAQLIATVVEQGLNRSFSQNYPDPHLV